MQFPPVSVLLALLFVSATLALPTDFNDIERRWSQGQSEAQIHAAHSIREATPAWPVVRAGTAAAITPEMFESTTDERTMQSRWSKRDQGANLLEKMRDFVKEFMQSKGETGMIGARKREEVESAPVLRPRRGMRYRPS